MTGIALKEDGYAVRSINKGILGYSLKYLKIIVSKKTSNHCFSYVLYTLKINLNIAD